MNGPTGSSHRERYDPLYPTTGTPVERTTSNVHVMRNGGGLSESISGTSRGTSYLPDTRMSESNDTPQSDVPESDSDERTLPYDMSGEYTQSLSRSGDDSVPASSGGPIDAFYRKSHTNQTMGDLAKERNKDKWYCPDDCVSVQVNPSVPNGAYAKGYFQKLLINRGCKGKYHVWGYSPFGKLFHNYKFGKQDMCPLCKEVHDGYNFDYKVKEGWYGGWKCWKTGEWESHYVIGEYEDLYI